MEKLIPIINKLQDVFHSVGLLDTIDLPQIAVVGSQSSGKSSVLESFVGRDFLPRGAGIVTRRPLVLQLIHNPMPEEKEKTQTPISETNNPYEWGEFLHLPNQKFHDFNEIRNQIVLETDRVTGKNKNVSPLPIHLKIYSPYVLNLTLIDLPGITKVPVGDQPKDIEIQIRKMILQFITKPNCVILAVSPANADIANSDALKMARETDTKGERTLGVLTKLDLMDPGTDAMDVLTNQVYPLKKGYVGVVLRGQNDINTNKSIKKSREDEMMFFQKHPSYKSVAERCGTQFLARTLNNMLLSHIRECLPDIRAKITALIIQAQQRLNEYGTPLAESAMSPGALLLQLLTKFSTEYTDSIDGRNADLSTGELFGGARINHIFVKKYSPGLSKMDACENLQEHDIRTAIRNAKGPRTSLFIPEAAFEMLVKKQVKMLEDPSLNCVDQVFEELKSIVDHCEKSLARFPNLRERVKEFVVSLLKGYSMPLKDFIRNLISIEMSYINTNHPDFFGGGQTAIMLMEKMNKQNAAVQQQQQMQAALQQQQQLQASQQVPQGMKKMPPTPQIVPQQQPLPQQTDEFDADWINVNKKQQQQQQAATPSRPPPPEKKKKTEVNNKQGFFSNFFGGGGALGSHPLEEDFPPAVVETAQQQVTQAVASAFQSQQQQPPQQPVYAPEPVQPAQPAYVWKDEVTAFHDREKMELDIIRTLLKEYFGIIRKNVTDSVPKSVMFFLVNKSKADMQSELVRALYKEDLFEDLLKENEEVANKRKATMKMLKVLQAANEIVMEVKDMKL